MNRIVSSILFGAVMALSLPAVAQQPPAGAGPDQGDGPGANSGGGRQGRWQQMRDRGGMGGGMRGGMGGGMGGGMRGGMGGGMRALDGILTDAQRAQVQALKQAGRARSQPLMEQMKSLRSGASGQMDAKTQAQFQALKQQLQAERKQTHEKIMGLLTPDQKAKLSAQRNSMGRPGGSGGPGGPGGQGGPGGPGDGDDLGGPDGLDGPPGGPGASFGGGPPGRQ